MTNLITTAANQTKCELANRAWQQLLQRALCRGFHGSATLEISIQDGTIQHVRHRLEQLEK